jgi:hypothetical protein
MEGRRFGKDWRRDGEKEGVRVERRESTTLSSNLERERR